MPKNKAIDFSYDKITGHVRLPIELPSPDVHTAQNDPEIAAAQNKIDAALFRLFVKGWSVSHCQLFKAYSPIEERDVFAVIGAVLREKKKMFEFTSDNRIYFTSHPLKKKVTLDQFVDIAIAAIGTYIIAKYGIKRKATKVQAPPH